MMPRHVPLGGSVSSASSTNPAMNFPINYLQRAGVLVQKVVTTTGWEFLGPLLGLPVPFCLFRKYLLNTVCILGLTALALWVKIEKIVPDLEEFAFWWSILRILTEQGFLKCDMWDRLWALQRLWKYHWDTGLVWERYECIESCLTVGLAVYKGQHQTPYLIRIRECHLLLSLWVIWVEHGGPVVGGWQSVCPCDWFCDSG